jgi:hypothetical protein
MLAPIVLGSDKTTVSVATGQNDFYPLYASLGNVHNSVRRAHRNAVSLIGFLAIPKSAYHLVVSVSKTHVIEKQLENIPTRQILGSSEDNSSIHHLNTSCQSYGPT